MLLVDKVLFRLDRRRKALLDLHRKAWNGVSILIFEDDSALTPRKHRINFYVIFFVGALLVALPLVALVLFVERELRQGSDPVEQVESRVVLLNTLRVMNREKGTLLARVDEQVREFQGLAWREDRALLARFAAERYTRFVRRTEPGQDLSTSELTELQNLRSRGLVLEETATMALNLIWNRMWLYHAFPRGWPLPPGARTVSSWFGVRENPMAIDLRSDQEFHHGIDISSSKGRAILATGPGEVYIAQNKYREQEGLGRYVTIHHGFGVVSTYGHCDVLLVEQGQRVRRGQVVARVGCTGRCTGSHVHFEVGLGIIPVQRVRDTEIRSGQVDPTPFMELK